MAITQNGDAKAVIQDIKRYEHVQDTMALLTVLALGQRQIDEGKIQPATEVLAKLSSRNNAG